MKTALEAADAFTVDIATSPEDIVTFRPKFSDYDVVVSNYNGATWSDQTQKDFTDYVESGGGLVIVHAADNSFGDWKEYNRIIGLGGWGDRNEKHGPYVYFQDGRFVRDETAGRGGNHGAQHEFTVIVRDENHPVTKGMPLAWLHTKDELYDMLRGPAEDMRILATAYSPVTKRHEPMIMTIRYGNGRVFHTPMGHADYSMRCVGFVSTLQRGTEWAATGEVTIPIPEDFPTENENSSRDY
jgi:type 1 glutamine amidotransferase